MSCCTHYVLLPQNIHNHKLSVKSFAAISPNVRTFYCLGLVGHS